MSDKVKEKASPLPYKIIKILHATIWLIFFDQLSKRLAIGLPKDGLTIIKSFFEFKYSENFGIAFSIAIPRSVLILGTIALLILLIRFLTKEIDLGKTVSQTSLGLILAGGMGNLIDRLLRGYVVDFISIWKWPIFNIADIYICLGVLLLIIYYGKIQRSPGSTKDKTS